MMTGVNDAGDMFFGIAGRGRLSLGRARSVIENRLCSGVIVTTDDEQSHRSVLRNMGCDHRPHDDREHGHLSGMDSHHSRIRGHPRRFNGVHRMVGTVSLMA